MDDDTQSAIQAALEAIDEVKTRVAALEDEARTAADGAGDKAKDASDATDTALSAKLDPITARLDKIEQYLSSILPAQVMAQAVSFAP